MSPAQQAQRTLLRGQTASLPHPSSIQGLITAALLPYNTGLPTVIQGGYNAKPTVLLC